MPNSSPRVTETAGACWATTITCGIVQGVQHFLDLALFAQRPVGQTAMHWPQLTQLETFRPSSKAVPILAFEPRPMKSMAATPWISSHIRTHLPQRMHLPGSRTIEGLEVSRKCRVRSPAKRRCRTPNSSARLCSWQVPLREQYEAVVGMVGQQQFDDGLAGLHGAGRMRADLHALGHGKGATGHQAALPLDLHDAHAAGAAGRQAFEVAERGHFDRRAAQGGQQHFALFRPERAGR